MASSKLIRSVGNLDAEVEAPPSKAYTLRALIIASMASGTTLIRNALLAEDQQYTISALRKLGTDIRVSGNNVEIRGMDGQFEAPDTPVFIGNSGVNARVLTVLCSLSKGAVIIDGSERMRVGRPIQDLIDALKPLGVEAESINGNGCLPVRVKGGSFKGGETVLKGDKSSQYFTAILMCAPYAQEQVTVKAEGNLASKPYLEVTADVMKSFGSEVTNNDYRKFVVHRKKYMGRDYTVEGDYSSASFFFAAAAITGGRIRVKNLNPNSAQGDKKFLDFLTQMGCSIKKGKNHVDVTGGRLSAIQSDMHDYPDIVVPLAVTAAFAKGKSEFRNISHLKYKECDRLQGPAKELRKMGIKAYATDDRLIIDGGRPHGAEIETYNDHRMAMSFAVAGLRVPGMKIKNPSAANKSFPGFFEILNSLDKQGREGGWREEP